MDSLKSLFLIRELLRQITIDLGYHFFLLFTIKFYIMSEEELEIYLSSIDRD